MEWHWGPKTTACFQIMPKLRVCEIVNPIRYPLITMDEEDWLLIEHIDDFNLYLSTSSCSNRL
jgi:hypothetical protein